jgi:hypothetical protein
VADGLRNFPPACGTGSVNPGCDSGVQSNGIDAAYWTSTGGGIYHVLRGTHHWGSDTSTWREDQEIEDIAAYWAASTQPGCDVTLPLE